MDKIILEGVNDFCDDEPHNWCVSDTCSCKGVVCNDCLAVRELDGESE